MLMNQPKNRGAIALARLRWAKVTPEQRRAQMAPAIAASPRTKAVDREERARQFWSHVDKSEGCWTWRGCKPWNYPCFRVDNETRAARVAYALTHGPIPKGMTVDHTCYVRPCVNPAHLELVTRAENSRRSASRMHAMRNHVRT